MKCLLPLLFFLLSLPLLATAEGGGFATAEDFGYTPPALTAAPHLDTNLERRWHPAGERPVHGTLHGFRGPWGNTATVILRMPTGRLKEYAATTLPDTELEEVRKWIEAKGFETFETYRTGKIQVRVHSVTPLRDNYFVMLSLSDGTHCCMRTNLRPVQRDFALQRADDTMYVTDATLDMLRRHAERKPQGTPMLPIVSTAEDALLYAALHNTGIVVLYLNRRGSEVDSAFRRYLEQNPEYVARWAGGFVFLVAYADEHGQYPPHCHQALLQLHYHHNHAGSQNPPFDTTMATIHMDNARIHNTRHVNYSVYLHNIVSGNPYTPGFSTRADSGNVSLPQMHNARADVFHFCGR